MRPHIYKLSTGSWILTYKLRNNIGTKHRYHYSTVTFFTWQDAITYLKVEYESNNVILGY